MATPRLLTTDQAVAALPRLEVVYGAAFNNERDGGADDQPATEPPGLTPRRFADSVLLSLDTVDGAEVSTIGDAQISGFGFGFTYQRGNQWPDTVGPALVDAGLGDWERDAFQLDTLAVEPARQEQGLGGGLLDFVRSRHRKVLLATSPANPAQRLFRRLGFRVLLPNYVYFGSANRSIIMGWQHRG